MTFHWHEQPPGWCFRVEIHAYLYAKGHASANATASAQATTAMRARVGLLPFVRGNVDAAVDEPTTETVPPSLSSASGDLELGVRLKSVGYLYENEVFRVGAEAATATSVRFDQDPWWTATACGRIDLDVFPVLGQESFHGPIVDPKCVYAGQAGGPAPNLTISPSVVDLPRGGTVQFRIDSPYPDAPVTWNSRPGEGTITPTGFYTAPTVDGQFIITAQSQPAGGRPAMGNVAVVRIGGPPGPPTFFTMSQLLPDTHPTGYHSFAVRYGPAASEGGAPVDFYNIAVDVDGVLMPLHRDAQPITEPGISIDDQGLPAYTLQRGHTYRMILRAYNRYGGSLPVTVDVTIMSD